ncbi:MAG: hypothetical protein M3Y91_14570 [Actinomycetota bacterium]|nr:hypothetical protein [Actinomycetota bacterium]
MDQITGTRSPLPALIGADAELAYGRKQQLPFDEFERTTLGLGRVDSATPASAR